MQKGGGETFRRYCMYIQCRRKVSPPPFRISPRKSMRLRTNNECSVLFRYLPHENEPHPEPPTLMVAEIQNSYVLFLATFEEFREKPVFSRFWRACVRQLLAL